MFCKHNSQHLFRLLDYFFFCQKDNNQIVYRRDIYNERFTVDDYDRENLEAKLRNATTSNRGLNYKSLDTDIVTVDSRGNVYGKKVGKGRIQISSKADPSIKKTVTVYVEWDD